MITAIRDAKGQHYEIPANVKAVRNHDRYSQCGSCKANAQWIFTSATASITRIYPGVEPDIRAAGSAACARHVRINLQRAASAQNTVLRFDAATSRWVESAER